MSSDLLKRYLFRKVDYDADDLLQNLVKSKCENIDNEWCPGIVDCTDLYGSRWSEEVIENYCREKSIAFDRYIEEDLECPARYLMYRPGENPIDIIRDVDCIDKRPYVFCDNITILLSDISRTESEKLERIAAEVQKVDFPCPRIHDYRSFRELEKGKELT